MGKTQGTIYTEANFLSCELVKSNVLYASQFEMGQVESRHSPSKKRNRKEKVIGPEQVHNELTPPL